MGSPPHTRGTQKVFNALFRRSGITPAYAGNTINGILDLNNGRDHPRIRGEHFNKMHGNDKELGSPPHTRGTQFLQHLFGRSPGITPAYAGNTPRQKESRTMRRDHPRIRGEHFDIPCQYHLIRDHPRIRGEHNFYNIF